MRVFFYAAPNGEPCGPFSEEQIRSLHKVGVIQPDSYVIEAGQQEWQSFAAAFPNDSLTVASCTNGNVCPNCGIGVPDSAQACFGCSFPIADYRENLAAARATQMRKIPYQASHLSLALDEIYYLRSKNIGCSVIGMWLLGGVLCLIPIVGWLFGPLLIMWGLVMLLMPFRGLIWMDKMFHGDQYEECCRRAHLMLRNRYQNVSCPVCGHVESELTWPDLGGLLECKSCQTKLVRDGDSLFFIPKRNGVPAGGVALHFGHLAKPL